MKWSNYHKEYLDFIARPVREYKIDKPEELWVWAMNLIDYISPRQRLTKSILDCGAASGGFVEYLKFINWQAVGIEINQPFAAYAQSKDRPVICADVCNIPVRDKVFDFVFSIHVLGLTSDFWLALKEMFRVSKEYVIVLVEVPGNPNKHYSMIRDEEIFNNFIKWHNVDVLWNGRWENHAKDWIFFIKKNT